MITHNPVATYDNVKNKKSVTHRRLLHSLKLIADHSMIPGSDRRSFTFTEINRMRKLFLVSLLGCCSLLLSCIGSSPENYFDIAVLNCNMMQGFAGNKLQREIESPSMKMTDEDKNIFAPMNRSGILNDKIKIITSNLAKLRQLKETAETRELINASVEVYDYVLPVYENEYRELVRLYDDGASEKTIASYARFIHEKYYPGYAELMEKLVAAGKPFAEKHNIKINPGIRSSPY